MSPKLDPLRKHTGGEFQTIIVSRADRQCFSDPCPVGVLLEPGFQSRSCQLRKQIVAGCPSYSWILLLLGLCIWMRILLPDIVRRGLCSLIVLWSPGFVWRWCCPPAAFLVALSCFYLWCFVGCVFVVLFLHIL